MPGRNLLLRILFGSLALAAVCGALGILYADYDAIWRVVWTAILTAVGSLLLLAATRHADKPQARPAALAAVTLIVLEYVLIVPAMWEFLGYDFSETLGGTALWVGLIGVPIIVFVAMLAKPRTRWAGRVGLVLAGVELAMLLAMTWSGQDTLGPLELESFAAGLAPAALGVVICLVGAGTDRRHWRWIGVIASAAALAIYLHHATTGFEGETPKVLLYLVCLAAAVAHANVVMLLPLRSNQLWLRHATIAASVVAAASTSLALTWEGDGDFVERLAGAAALVAGCGTVALAVLGRLNQRMNAPAATIPEVREIVVQCPVCQKKQPIPIGGARCAGCNLLIHVRVEEPRCAACGYSLLMLKADKCPECGAPVEPTPAQTAPLPAPA